METVAFALFFITVGGVTVGYLAYKGYADQDALLGWIGATMCVLGGFLTMFGYIGEHGIAPDMPGSARQIATFISVLATLGALTGGVVWWLHKRPQTAQTASRTNYVSSGASYAYGSYTPADIKAARAKATQARKEVRA